MATNQASDKSACKPRNIHEQTGIYEAEDVLPDLNNPDEFRKAFIASEILNRKY